MIIRVQKRKKDKIMKKIYLKPESTEVVLNSIPLLNPTSVNPKQAEGGTPALAPELPGISDDELFQFIMIH